MLEPLAWREFALDKGEKVIFTTTKVSVAKGLHHVLDVNGAHRGREPSEA